ncbi:MAG: DUF177 domain-containing protein [Rhodobacteraceae bacterium]|nr:MAG: DUF177 domain-containing protein [Paracoccaceae bacterium]
MTDTILRTKDITKPTAFSLSPDAETRAALAEDLGITAIRKLTFSGEIAPDGPKDLILTARLGATVVQPCVVTLAPVTTRIDETATRSYRHDMPAVPEGEEVEMPEDETAEPLPIRIDLTTVMAEALALSLPDWPRAEGVEPVEISVSEPGKDPMTDNDVKPFAALKSLRDKLGENDGEND